MVADIAGEISDVLNKSKHVFVTAHVNPDGDAIGSCLAFGLFIKKMGIDVKVILEHYNEKYDVIPGKELLYVGELDSLDADTVICLDCGTLDRLGHDAKALFERGTYTVNIDHHLDNGNFADINYTDPKASSTCELVFELLTAISPLEQDIASAIYAGLVFDTGGFRHGCTGTATYHAAGVLVGLGIPFTHIYNELMYRHTLTEARIFGKALENLIVIEEYKIAYSTLSMSELQAFHATSQDLDGVVEYLLNIEGIELSILFYEKAENNVKASFRSKEARVNKICNVFDGGGHRNAAGCTINTSMEQAVTKVIAATKNELEAGLNECE